MYLYEGGGNDGGASSGGLVPGRDRRLTDFDSVGKFIVMVALVLLVSEGRSDVSISVFGVSKLFPFPNLVSG